MPVFSTPAQCCVWPPHGGGQPSNSSHLCMVQLLAPELLRHEPRSAVLQVVEGRHAAQWSRQHRPTTVASSVSVIVQLINLQQHTHTAGSRRHARLVSLVPAQAGTPET
jgi:hypothetical protein